MIRVTIAMNVPWTLASDLTFLLACRTAWYLVCPGFSYYPVYRFSWCISYRTAWYHVLPGISYVLVPCTSLFIVFPSKAFFLMCRSAYYLLASRTFSYLVLLGISHCLVSRIVWELMLLRLALPVLIVLFLSFL